jgi:hypothetical protein
VNVLGSVFGESILHATSFAFVGSVLYLGLRRWSPAAGALLAASTLIVMALVSALAFLPWPRWEVSPSLQALPDRLADWAQARPLAKPDERRAANRDLRDTTASTEAGAAEQTPADKPSMLLALIQAVARRSRSPVEVESRSAWGWRSWLVVGLLGTTALGLSRLAWGLRAMRRLRHASQPLGNQSLDDVLATLRAEMRCLKPVELRTSRVLATPATIGWRRILILLPEDWTSWDDAERRAVLAHELAHVCRGDFFAGLLAQFSVAIQFYHPLAHWLAARLRLEQELAADAWTARLSGGNLNYLTILARMALRRDDRSLSWPARAFLPSRGTFVRRIEMLRSSNHVRHVWLSSRIRYLTVGSLAALGVLVAGVRGPMSAAPAGPQIGAAREAAVAEKGDLDLSFLPAETRMFLAVRPSAILGRPEMSPVVKQIRDSWNLASEILVPLDEVEQLVLFWEGDPTNPDRPGTTPLIPTFSGFIVRASGPQSWTKTAEGQNLQLQPVQHSGETYYRPTGKAQGPHGILSVYFPDARTGVWAREDLLRLMIEDVKAPRARHGWDEAWKQVSKGQLGAALETRWLRRRLNQGFAGGPQDPQQMKLETIGPLLEKARAYAVGVDMGRELTVDVVALTGSPDDLKPVTETAQALLTLGRNAMPSMRDNARDMGRFKEINEWAHGLVATLLDKARLDTAGASVHMGSSAPFDMVQAARFVGSFFQGAQFESSRFSSANNLKQIALAIHNYANAQNHLPPPVLYGGKSSRVPYSWRVAILPYLEQQELYNAYNFDEPWDGPNNSKLLESMPAVYAHPVARGGKSTYTSYFVFTGPDTMLGKGEKPGFPDITDGTSNTLLAVEAKRDVPWTKPEDIPFDAHGPLPQLGGFTPDGFNAGFGDGSVRYIKQTIKPEVLRALITRAGGEVISLDQF